MNNSKCTDYTNCRQNCVSKFIELESMCTATRLITHTHPETGVFGWESLVGDPDTIGAAVGRETAKDPDTIGAAVGRETVEDPDTIGAAVGRETAEDPDTIGAAVGRETAEDPDTIGAAVGREMSEDPSHHFDWRYAFGVKLPEPSNVIMVGVNVIVVSYLSLNVASCSGENRLRTDESDSGLLPSSVSEPSARSSSADSVSESTEGLEVMQSFKIASGLNGYTPVFFKPAHMLSTLIPFDHACLKRLENWNLVMTRPGWLNMYSRQA